MSTKRLDGLSVLILEDDYYQADDARIALENAGAHVLGPFPRAAEALTKARHAPPDCALVDANLGNGPSFEPAEELAGMGLPVVFVTGYDQTVIPKSLAHLPCLQKPVQRQSLVDAVGLACGR
jgi:FixJ family two-component response regulator